MVAAWMRAETGVGPSIASGSQTWSGNWALLPTAPQKSSRAMPVITQASIWPPARPSESRSKTSLKFRVPTVVQTAKMPEREADVADAVDQERLLGRDGRAGPRRTRSR